MSGSDSLSETSRLLDEHVLENAEDQEEGQVNRIFLAVTMIGETVIVSIGEDV